MTKRETLSDDKARIEKLNDRIQLCNNFKAELKDAKGLSMEAGKNNIAESLRNYANRDDIDVVFKCVLAEAAATLESVTSERDNLLNEVHILHEERNSRED